MSWLLSILVAVLTAAVGLFVAGFVASLAVSWYHVSSFEGGSGYFVVMWALFGGIAGFVIGLVASRQLHTFLPALGASLGILCVLVGAVGGTARLLADVPPTIDGETLVLAVEVRWPASQTARPTAPDGDEPYLVLGALSGSTQRKSAEGPLWLEDARQEGGRWIAPGAVDIFTNRGRRSIGVMLGDSSNGLLMPLRHPSKSDTVWSDWMPHARPGAPPLPDMVSFRYRVLKASEPLRTQTIGPFEIVTHASGFNRETVEKRNVISARATFDVRHRGQSVPVATDGGHVDEIAVLGAAPRPALIVHVGGSNVQQICRVVIDDGDQARVETLDECYGLTTISELTTDSTRWGPNKRSIVRGRVDRGAFDGARYLFTKVLFDATTLEVLHFAAKSEATVAAMPPLTVSPDGRGFARFGFAEGSEEKPVFVVTDVARDRTEDVPIDRVGTRMPRVERLGPTWADHYFAWTHGTNGTWHLEPRRGVAPLAFSGRLETDGATGAYYWLEPAGEALRDTLMDFLAREMHAERLPADSGMPSHPMRVDGVGISVSSNEDSRYVAIFLEHGVKDARVIPEIARRFNAELATGKYDKLFDY